MSNSYKITGYGRCFVTKKYATVLRKDDNNQEEIRPLEQKIVKGEKKVTVHRHKKLDKDGIIGPGTKVVKGDVSKTNIFVL